MANIPTKLSSQEIKVMISKYRALYANRNGPGDWGKYYPCEKIIFTPGVEFTTEADLTYYMFQKFGEGRFQLLAWAKGHEGFWKYWLGNIYENGFIRDKDKNKEMERLKAELAKSKDFEDREMIEEEMDFEKEIKQEESKSNKFKGPIGLVKFNAGTLHAYDEPAPIRRRMKNEQNEQN